MYTSLPLLYTETWKPEMTVHTFKRQLKAYLFHIWCVDEQKEHPPPPGVVVAFFHDSGAAYKTADLLIYLLYTGQTEYPTISSVYSKVNVGLLIVYGRAADDWKWNALGISTMNLVKISAFSIQIPLRNCLYFNSVPAIDTMT